MRLESLNHAVPLFLRNPAMKKEDLPTEQFLEMPLENGAHLLFCKLF
jgi:hypothetical protein